VSRRPRSLSRQAAGLARQLPRPHGLQFRPPRSRTGRTMLGVVGALVLVLGAALLTDPEPVRAGSGAGTRVTVRSTTAVCWHPESLGETRIAIAAPPARPVTGDSGTGGRSGKGKATVTEYGSKDRESSMLTISEPGTSTYRDLARAPKELLIAKAVGAVAPGFTASQTIRTGGDASTRSLSGTPCPQAGTEFWFAGTGSNGKSRTAWLYLINPENAKTRVDVELYGDDGPVEGSGLDAIVLKPGQTWSRPLQVVTGQPHERLVVHVVARVGRVAAALYDNAHSGLQPRGADWIPTVAAASSRLIVPAVPGGTGERTLYLFVPGEDGALAKVKLVGKNGTFSPAPDKKADALDTIALEGNQLKQVSLTDAAGEEPFGVLVEADRPLIAALRVGTGDNPPEIAYLAATPPLGGPSVVADARNADGATSKLVLTAPGETAKVSVVALVKGEEPREVRDVEIKAGSSREVSLSQIKGAFAIMITPQPGSGPVYASRVLSERSSDGDLLTIEQFQPSHTTELVPDVVNDLSAGLRPGE
jgi:hypothetical protein